jgi:hypothetical protein
VTRRIEEPDFVAEDTARSEQTTRSPIDSR